jgi:hypothetical protein
LIKLGIDNPPDMPTGKIFMKLPMTTCIDSLTMSQTIRTKAQRNFGPKLLSLLLTQNISANIYVLLETEQLIGSSIIDLEISSC